MINRRRKRKYYKRSRKFGERKPVSRKIIRWIFKSEGKLRKNRRKIKWKKTKTATMGTAWVVVRDAETK
jgi:hypothetical protein